MADEPVIQVKPYTAPNSLSNVLNSGQFSHGPKINDFIARNHRVLDAAASAGSQLFDDLYMQVGMSNNKLPHPQAGNEGPWAPHTPTPPHLYRGPLFEGMHPSSSFQKDEEGPATPPPENYQQGRLFPDYPQKGQLSLFPPTISTTDDPKVASPSPTLSGKEEAAAAPVAGSKVYKKDYAQAWQNRPQPQQDPKRAEAWMKAVTTAHRVNVGGIDLGAEDDSDLLAEPKWMTDSPLYRK